MALLGSSTCLFGLPELVVDVLIPYRDAAAFARTSLTGTLAEATHAWKRRAFMTNGLLRASYTTHDLETVATARAALDHAYLLAVRAQLHPSSTIGSTKKLHLSDEELAWIHSIATGSFEDIFGLDEFTLQSGVQLPARAQALRFIIAEHTRDILDLLATLDTRGRKDEEHARRIQQARSHIVQIVPPVYRAKGK